MGRVTTSRGRVTTSRHARDHFAPACDYLVGPRDQCGPERCTSLSLIGNSVCYLKVLLGARFGRASVAMVLGVGTRESHN